MNRLRTVVASACFALTFTISSMASALDAQSNATAAFFANAITTGMLQAFEEEQVAPLSTAQRSCFMNTKNARTVAIMQSRLLQIVPADELHQFDAFFTTRLGQDIQQASLSNEPNALDKLLDNDLDRYSDADIDALLAISQNEYFAMLFDEKVLEKALDNNQVVSQLTPILMQKITDCNLPTARN